MKVLVTGAGGRIGTHLSRLLLAEGHEVRAFGLADDPQLVALKSFGAQICPGDLEAPDTIIPAAQGVDAVCHLAAALTTHDVTDDRFVDVNLRGTFNVLEAVRRGAPGLQRFVYTSSDAVYMTTVESGEGTIDESHELLPGTVYGATKVGAELLCRSYWRSYGIPFTVMRPTATANPSELVRPDSVFGRRWFVSAAIQWLSTRQAPTADQLELLELLQSVADGTDKLYALLAEDGSSSESTYADARDAAAGMRAMLEPDAPIGEAFNIGPAGPHDDRALVKHIGSRLGMDVVEIRHRSVRPSWRISTERAQAVLGYRPQRTVFTMVDEATAELVAGGSR